MEIKEPVQSTFCDNGIIIDGIKLLTFNTKVKRMKGKTAPLMENLLEDFHMPQGMNALLTSCFTNILTIRGERWACSFWGVPLPFYSYSPSQGFFFFLRATLFL